MMYELQRGEQVPNHLLLLLTENLGKFDKVMDKEIPKLPILIVHWHALIGHVLVIADLGHTLSRGDSLSKMQGAKIRDIPNGPHPVHTCTPILNLCPSRCSTSEMVSLIRRSLPRLSHRPSKGCRIMNFRSPGSPSTTGSPSSKNEMTCPGGMPGSMCTVRDSESRSNLTLGHFSQT
jgi:hypothetical protein